MLEIPENPTLGWLMTTLASQVEQMAAHMVGLDRRLKAVEAFIDAVPLDADRLAAHLNQQEAVEVAMSRDPVRWDGMAKETARRRRPTLAGDEEPGER